jgi:hypothetical protein
MIEYGPNVRYWSGKLVHASWVVSRYRYVYVPLCRAARPAEVLKIDAEIDCPQCLARMQPEGRASGAPALQPSYRTLRDC